MRTPFTRARAPLGRRPACCGVRTRPAAAATMPAAARSNQGARSEVLPLMPVCAAAGRGRARSAGGASWLGDVDRARPGALLVLGEAVVVEGRAIVAVAGVDRDALALLVVLATQ